MYLKDVREVQRRIWSLFQLWRLPILWRKIQQQTPAKHFALTIRPDYNNLISTTEYLLEKRLKISFSHDLISFIFLHPSTWILHSFFIASSPITLVINYWFPRFTTWEWTDHSTTMVSQSPLPVWRGWVLQTAESGSLRPHRQLFQQTRSRI